MKVSPHILLALILTGLLLTTGCFEELDLETPEHDSVLVLNSVFSPDSLWNANLSQSVGVFEDNRPEFIEDATIEIFDAETDQLIANLTSRPLGEYDAFGPQPELGKSYRLVASAPGFPDIEAVSEVPEPAEILSVTWQDTVVWSLDTEEPEGLVSFEFQDDPNEENYYFISLARADTAGNFMDTLVFFNPVQFISYDPTLETEIEGALLSDFFFNGKTRTVNIHPQSQDLRPGQNLWLFLGTISKDFYLYRLSMIEQERATLDPFYDARDIHTNVNGGFGIFAGYSVDSIQVK